MEVALKGDGLTIHESDVSSALCRSCARCCEITLKLPATDSRYRRFLRSVGFELAPAAEAGLADCCDEVHDVTVRFGPCAHLTGGHETGFSCNLYGSEAYPELCEHYNCVSWAKVNNAYSADNEIVAHAQAALDRLRC